jgi:hypothetical protein
MVRRTCQVTGFLGGKGRRGIQWRTAEEKGDIAKEGARLITVEIMPPPLSIFRDFLTP